MSKRLDKSSNRKQTRHSLSFPLSTTVVSRAFAVRPETWAEQQVGNQNEIKRNPTTAVETSLDSCKYENDYQYQKMEGLRYVLYVSSSLVG